MQPAHEGTCSDREGRAPCGSDPGWPVPSLGDGLQETPAQVWVAVFRASGDRHTGSQLAQQGRPGARPR